MGRGFAAVLGFCFFLGLLSFSTSIQAKTKTIRCSDVLAAKQIALAKEGVFTRLEALLTAEAAKGNIPESDKAFHVAFLVARSETDTPTILFNLRFPGSRDHRFLRESANRHDLADGRGDFGGNLFMKARLESGRWQIELGHLIPSINGDAFQNTRPALPELERFLESLVSTEPQLWFNPRAHLSIQHYLGAESTSILTSLEVLAAHDFDIEH